MGECWSQTKGHKPMKIQVQHIANVRTGPVKRPHLPDHGQDGGELTVRVIEGDAEHAR